MKYGNISMSKILFIYIAIAECPSALLDFEKELWM
jgi:hypothetical protein